MDVNNWMAEIQAYKLYDTIWRLFFFIIIQSNKVSKRATHSKDQHIAGRLQFTKLNENCSQMAIEVSKWPIDGF